MQNDKEKKIMKEIEQLTPYLAELQEFKENGLYLPGNTTASNKITPIFDEQGKRIDTKKKKQSNAQKRTELREKALKVRILAINKHLDDVMADLFPASAIWLIRKWPWMRPIVMKMLFTSVGIVRNPNPKPLGSDVVTVKCFWTTYSEVKFVWEK